ncbi:spore protease YyaC [Lederbergia sp. NSJ-179]|uniref:spore protease YyaC n=1 Tax=Lederbergia sp. NSJ-179 TaxID=2931402 RepID=UPI001FD02D98|nr:spore protease YyaC [Lederbergia sp. NSJ-179]
MKTIADGILEFLPLYKRSPIIIVCIGTDRSTGDSLGPLTGSFLQEADFTHFHVYGTLEEPVHAVNLKEKLQEIQEKYTLPFIIGIDACLGRMKNIGMIKVGSGPVKPGAGVKKDLPTVGHMHITGIVNVSGYMEFFVLQNTRLNLVMKMAKHLASAIIQSDQLYAKQKNTISDKWDFTEENYL